MTRKATVLCVALAACAGRPSFAPRVTPPRSWIEAQEVGCGEIRGRLIHGPSGTAVTGAIAFITRPAQAVRLDAAGVFQLRREGSDPLPAILRVQSIGIEPVLIELRDPVNSRGYVIEIVAEPGGMHQDTYTAVTVRRPAYCA